MKFNFYKLIMPILMLQILACAPEEEVEVIPRPKEIKTYSIEDIYIGTEKAAHLAEDMDSSKLLMQSVQFFNKGEAFNFKEAVSVETKCDGGFYKKAKLASNEKFRFFNFIPLAVFSQKSLGLNCEMSFYLQPDEGELIVYKENLNIQTIKDSDFQNDKVSLKFFTKAQLKQQLVNHGNNKGGKHLQFYTICGENVYAFFDSMQSESRTPMDVYTSITKSNTNVLKIECRFLSIDKDENLQLDSFFKLRPEVNTHQHLVVQVSNDENGYIDLKFIMKIKFQSNYLHKIQLSKKAFQVKIWDINGNGPMLYDLRLPENALQGFVKNPDGSYETSRDEVDIWVPLEFDLRVNPGVNFNAKFFGGRMTVESKGFLKFAPIQSEPVAIQQSVMAYVGTGLGNYKVPNIIWGRGNPSKDVCHPVQSNCFYPH